MLYTINNVTFNFEGSKLIIDNKTFDCKNTTLRALKLFLNSEGNVVNKDDLLNYIWQDVIVSEASVFKQVQLVRKIFTDFNLPKDIIENVYGKGYRIKYPICQSLVNQQSTEAKNKSTEAKNKSYKNLYLALIVLIMVAFFINKYLSSNDMPKYLSLNKRESMISLMNNDWQKGLQHVKTILKKDINHLSQDDQAFLYEKKGLAQYHLQDYKQSIATYHNALKRYEKLNNIEHMGQLHLNIASSHGLLSNSSKTYEIQREHINAAIELFNKINKKQKQIDAQMILAQFYKKNNKIYDAIKIYQKTILDAQKIDDKIGEMIALNNLAATHLILNEFDKAIELGEKGLEMTLEIGVGRYIASSYSFLSDLYQEQYRITEALDMIQQAIKYQLTNKDFSYLSPKLMTLNFLLVQTYQYEKADDLLNLSYQYAQSLGMDNGLAMVSLYKGLNAARKGDWDKSEYNLSQSLERAQSINFKYKQPLNMAYLALAHYFNNNYLQAIEPATTVFNDEKSNPQAKAIAALALAYTYSLMEKNELADKWFLQSQNLLNPKWLFEQKLFLILKLERQNRNNSIFISQTENEILDLSAQMLALAKKTQMDKTIFLDLKSQISNKIATIEKETSINQ